MRALRPVKINGSSSFFHKTTKRQICLLANSGCLKNCSAHTFHDNLVAHEHEAAIECEGAWSAWRGVCWPYLAKEAGKRHYLANSTWVRPEELSLYEGIIDVVKLATRMHENFGKVVEAYSQRAFSGNILSLCEPDFSQLLNFDNKSFPPGWQTSAASPDSPGYEELYRKVRR